MKNPFYRPPDVIIGGTDHPYLLRWWVIPRNRFLNVYLHKFLRSDEERALHDHPWPSISILLRGGFYEHHPEGHPTLHLAPEIIRRDAITAHRTQLLERLPWASTDPVPPVTLFITGPKCREWGFLCPQGWRHWKQFVAGHDPRTGLSRGCGED
jgi:hypothetical protein